MDLQLNRRVAMITGPAKGMGAAVTRAFAADPVGRAVEDVHGRPEEIVEVGFEAGVLQRSDQGVEDVGDGARDRIAIRQEPLVGFILEGAVAVELKLGEEMVGV